MHAAPRSHSSANRCLRGFRSCVGDLKRHTFRQTRMLCCCRLFDGLPMVGIEVADSRFFGPAPNFILGKTEARLRSSNLTWHRTRQNLIHPRETNPTKKV